MQINSLMLDNFTSHKRTFLEFKKTPRIHLFLGSLNAGKSSLKKAIEYALVGQCESYRKRNDDLRDLIHDLDGAKRFQVRVDTNLGIAERGVALTNRYVEWINEKGESKDVVDIPFRASIVSACLNTTDFFLWDHKAQKEAILNIIGVEVTHEAIVEKFEGDPAALGMFLQGYKFNSIPVLDAAYEKVYRERTDTNREIKTTKAPDPPEGDEPPLEQITKQLEELEAQEKEAIAQTAELIGKGKGQVKSELEWEEDEVRALTAWFENNPKPTKEEANKLNTALNKAKKAEAEHKKKMAELERKRTYALAHMTQHSQAKVLLEQFDGSCIGATFKCPAQVKEITDAVLEQTGLEKERQDEAADLMEEMSALASKFTHPADIEHEMSIFKERAKEYKANQDKLAAAEKKAEELRGMLEGDSGTDPEVEKLEKWKAELAERIKVGKGVLEKARQWKVRREQVKQVAQRMKELEIEKRHLESLVEFFGPKGVRLQLIEDKVSKFQAAVNEHLEMFGFELDIQVDPWLVKARSRPVASLSRSERFRLGVALQIALAKWSKMNFICVDNAEILTPPFREIMLDMIKEAKLDQSFIFWTLMVPDEEFEKPPVKWVKFYLVKNEEGVSNVTQL